MSMILLPLADCPFCEGGLGMIAMNTAAVAAARRDQPEGFSLCIPATPDQQIILFNSGSADPKPCPHLIQLHGSCGDRSPKWGFSFDWLWPRKKELDPDDHAGEFLWDCLLQGDVPPEVRPKTRYEYAPFELRWQHRDVADSFDAFYTTDGGALHAADPEAFFKELLVLDAKHQQWLKEHPTQSSRLAGRC